MLNRVILIGRLTKDPESQYTTSGIAVAKFGLACDRDFKNKETGEKETDFFNIVAWRRTAEFVMQYVTKGTLVAVEGRIENRSWIKQDGTKGYITEIVADNCQILSRPRGEESNAPSEEGGYAPRATAQPAAAPARTPAARETKPAYDDLDDVDPFADE